MSDPVMSPAGDPRPPRSAVLQATGTTVVTALSTIASWIVGLGLDLLPIAPPPEVRAAFIGLTLIGVAFGVSLLATKMREAEWSEKGETTGLKKIL